MGMLAKLETKSNRVKGLSFHPTRPWILASLHNGIVQLWDYRIRTLLDRYDEHDGPVRGVCFHSSQPLFVSGGDDYKIKVWSYKQRRCLFTLLGHLDYIRTVEFHKEYPWILSASDDQTIRIWNWQSRACIAVLTGHNHYVMCASFHPKDDMVVSASLDQTVRVWDVSGLRKKTVAPGAHSAPQSHQDDGLRLPQSELFGNTDAIVKYVLEGHERGVNWAAFHPTMPLIVSGADDRHVKLWRMNESKAWEVDTFRGHFNNVSCVLFHPRQEIVISNSEDKTIRVWDTAKRSGIQTFRREHDRFWILTAHPEMNLFAAGHDSGMIVFKLERERPAYTADRNESLFYVKDKYVRTCDFASSRDVPVLARSKSSTNGKVRNLSYSAQDKAILLCSDTDGGHYELYQIPADGKGESVESKRGLGLHAIFIGRKRFAVLDKSNQIVVRNLKNEETKRCPAPHTVDCMFPATAGLLLLKGEDKMTLFDVQQKKSMAELNTPEIKYVFWSEGKEPQVALVGKDTVIIANRKLEQLCIIHETIRIKSGAWDENNIFIYSTLNHMKYCLSNGDNGIIRTLDTPLYITAVRGNRIYCLDRECKNRVISIDPTEYMFKYALLERRFGEVLRMVKEYNLIGQSIISYLQKKGFPEVALHFVKEEKTRFNLALECGNLEVALESCKVLDDNECWHKLGVEALRQGNHQTVEMAYQRTKNFEGLSFLYFITGNVDKLKKMLKISEMRNDTMSRFHNTLYLGDVTERVRLLEEVGQIPLAYATAAIHNLAEAAGNLAQKLGPDNLPILPVKATLLKPPTPILRLHEANWPLLTVSKGVFEMAMTEEKPKFSRPEISEEDLGEAKWDDLNLGEEEDGQDEGGIEKQSIAEDEGEATQWDVALDLGDELDGLEVTTKSEKSFVVLPHAGPSVLQKWCANSSLPADHAAAGSFDSAMKLLNQQAGVVNFAPLKPFFLSLHSGSQLCIPTIPGLNPLPSPLCRVPGALPTLTVSLPPLIENRLKAGYKATTQGKFNEALSHFVFILHSLLFIVVESKRDANEPRELLAIARDYIVGLHMELERKDPKIADDPVRQAELAAYFTHCNLEPIHLMLSLRSAMTCAYKIKNYQTASSFARRLLELEPKEDVAMQARKVIKFCEQNNQDAHTLNYNERNPFVVCATSFKPIYKGSPCEVCPFCQASYQPQCKGSLCPTCEVAQIGSEATGIQFINTTTKEKGRK